MSKVSILTPSYNYKRFMHTAIASTLGDPKNGSTEIEHVIMDGCSTDGTADMLTSMPHKSLKWFVESDRGQSDALNKALKVASGDIIGWLNADDFYLPGTIGHVAKRFDSDPSLDVLIGDTILVNGDGDLIRLFRSYPARRSIVAYRGTTLMSTSMFFRRSALGDEPFDVNLRRVMDWDLYLRLLSNPRIKFGYIRRPLGAFRFHEEQVTHNAPAMDGGLPVEHWTIYRKHGINARQARFMRPLANAMHKSNKLLRGHFQDEKASRRLAGTSLLNKDGCISSKAYDEIVARSYRLGELSNTN